MLNIIQNVVYLHRNQTKGYNQQRLKHKMTKEIQFTKMHGAGNDYIYIDTARYPIAQPEALAVAWSKPHTGIGSDGLVLIGPSEEADFSMRIFNADGSEAKMCGNASRCIGKYVYEHGLTRKTTVTLHTLSGIKVLHLHLDPSAEQVKSVTVDMGIPTDEPVDTDGKGARPFREQPIEADGRHYTATAISMGNPHLVIFVDHMEQIQPEADGPLLERHPYFPDRVNVEFACLQPDGSIRMRVWERGSGITQACGTGACATAAAAFLTGRCGRKATIVMDGGTLQTEWEAETGHLLMTGPAVTVFEGSAEIASE